MTRVLVVLIVILIPGILPGQQADTITKDRQFVIYPAFGYQPETSLQLGIIAVVLLKSEDESQTKFKRRSSFSPFFLYTFRNQILSELNLDYYFSKGMNLNTSLKVFSFPDFYFGIGGDNEADVKERYTNTYARLNGQFYAAVNPNLFIGVSYDLHTTRIKDVVAEGMLASDGVIGLSGGNIMGLGPSFKYDSRDNVLYPSKGYFVLMESTFNQLGDFNYTSYTIDIKRFFSIRNKRNIIALQVNGRFTSGTDIPFYKLPQLGGAERLRGIANASLYRDRQSIYSQVEYRRHLFWRIGMTAFLGMGDVAPVIKDLDLSSFKYVTGVGYRFAVIPDQKLNLRFDFGISNEGQTGFYLGMQESF